MTEHLDHVRVDVDPDGIALVTLDNPAKRNAITPELSRTMNVVLDRLAADRAVRVVIVTGAGDAAFCAGMSLEHFRTYRDRVWELYTPGESMMDWWAKLRALPQPTIAAVNGVCVGGGFCILDACDLAIASERATFGLSEVNFGSVPGGGALRAVLEMMPLKRAMHLVLTGQPIDAAAASQAGLVNEVVAHDDVVPAARRLAALLVRHPWQTLEFCKRTAYGSREIPNRRLAIEYETAMAHFQHQARPPRTAGAQEAFAAFGEKRFKPGLEPYDPTREKP